LDAFGHALILLLVVAILSVLARWIPWPSPITYVLGGAVAAFCPAFPRVALDPDFFFLCFLPPLLFSDSWLMPLREFSKALRPIFFLATGLVIFTTVSIGWLAHRLIGLPLPLAFALGAVISPTDAVAVGAITEKLKVPTRLTIVLNGESLMNDATGLVAFKFALLALIGGTFSVWTAAGEFSLVSAGGLAAGLAVGFGVGKVRDWLIRWRSSDPMIELTLSLLTPYAAYLLGDSIEVSGVLAVVGAGLYSGWRDPVRMDPEARQTTWAVWSTVIFWLNGLAFVLLGLQFPHLLRVVRVSYSIPRLLEFVGLISALAMALRILWFFPGAYLPFVLSKKVRRTEQPPSWQTVLAGGWAGMRGTVTLAAAMSLPLTLANGSPFPDRDLVIFLAFGTIASTLLIQGTTLSWLICKLGLQEDGTRKREDRLARIAAVSSGLEVLKALQQAIGSAEEQAAITRVIGEYEERTAELEAQGESQANAHLRLVAERRFRLAALAAERSALDDLWRRDVIVDEVYRPLQQLLDSEEMKLRHTSTMELEE
jgi:CPA1 family monovalent cation:H+ antiporter